MIGKLSATDRLWLFSHVPLSVVNSSSCQSMLMQQLTDECSDVIGRFSDAAAAYTVAQLFQLVCVLFDSYEHYSEIKIANISVIRSCRNCCVMHLPCNHKICYYLRRRLASGEGIVTVGVTLSRCVCVCCVSLGGKGNALYPVLSGCQCGVTMLAWHFYWPIYMQNVKH